MRHVWRNHHPVARLDVVGVTASNRLAVELGRHHDRLPARSGLGAEHAILDFAVNRDLSLAAEEDGQVGYRLVLVGIRVNAGHARDASSWSLRLPSKER